MGQVLTGEQKGSGVKWSVKVILAEVGTRSGQYDFEPFT